MKCILPARVTMFLVLAGAAAAAADKPAEKTPAAPPPPAAPQPPAQAQTPAKVHPAAKAQPARKIHPLLYAQDGSGVFGYKDTPIQPWSGFHVHDPDRPKPRRVDPGPAPAQALPVPADALVLWGGSDLSPWEPTDWKIADGFLESVGHSKLTTRRQFGSIQLHVEWRAPDPPQGAIMDRGNNGVQLGGYCEVQVFDSYTTKIYADGQAAAIYAQTPPLVDPSRPPGQWQIYDIVYTAPKLSAGKVLQPARITMFFNGVLVHWNQEIFGRTHHLEISNYNDVPERGPVVLLGHNNPVRFRSIWVRPLD